MSNEAIVQFIIKKDDTEISTLHDLCEALEQGLHVVILKDGEELTTLRFKATDDSKNKFGTNVVLHGVSASDLGQVVRYILGDAHARSKIQWSDGTGHYKNFFAN